MAKRNANRFPISKEGTSTPERGQGFRVQRGNRSLYGKQTVGVPGPTLAGHLSPAYLESCVEREFAFYSPSLSPSYPCILDTHTQTFWFPWLFRSDGTCFIMLLSLPREILEEETVCRLDT